MGNSLSSSEQFPSHHLSKSLFEFQYLIGKGGYSKVWKGIHRHTRQPLAIKEMRKSRIIAKKNVHSALNERRLLSMIKHPFLTNIQYAFQDIESLYLVLDFMPGGDLGFHLSKRRFSEEETKFLVVCIVTALEYLHVNQIIHRDIKPENLIFDKRGYLRLADFGIARESSMQIIKDKTGTIGYMAPEVLLRRPQTFAVDYFSLGTVVYEIMTGKKPYIGANKKEILESMMYKQAVLKRSDVPEGWSLEAADFVNKLLARKQKERLGTNGILEIKNHQWIRDFPWKKVLEKTYEPPFKPSGPPQCQADATEDHNDSDSEFSINEFQSLFAGYVFQSTAKSSRSEDPTYRIHN